MFAKASPPIVVSESDLEEGVSHLRSLPFSPNLPRSWDRQRLVQFIKEAIGQKPKVGDAFDVAPGIFAIIKPFGIDLAGPSCADGRLQVWLAVRKSGTVQTRVIAL